MLKMYYLCATKPTKTKPMTNYFDTPEGNEDCPQCGGSGYFEYPLTMCDDCPFGTRDCTECMAAKDHLVDNGVFCEFCGGHGQVTESEAREWKNDSYAEMNHDLLNDIFEQQINGYKH